MLSPHNESGMTPKKKSLAARARAEREATRSADERRKENARRFENRATKYVLDTHTSAKRNALFDSMRNLLPDFASFVAAHVAELPPASLKQLREAVYSRTWTAPSPLPPTNVDVAEVNELLRRHLRRPITSRLRKDGQVALYCYDRLSVEETSEPPLFVGSPEEARAFLAAARWLLDFSSFAGR